MTDLPHSGLVSVFFMQELNRAIYDYRNSSQDFNRTISEFHNSSQDFNITISDFRNSSQEFNKKISDYRNITLENNQFQNHDMTKDRACCVTNPGNGGYEFCDILTCGTNYYLSF